MDITSKAEAIRQAIQKHGMDTPFTLIEDAVKKCTSLEDPEITPQQVSNEKRRLRQKREEQTLSIETLKRVKGLVDEIGSVCLVRQALDEIDQMQYDRQTSD